MSLVKNLKWSRGDFKLDIQEWELPDSGLFALLGPSGCGKSTCIKIMMGLIDADGFSWNWGKGSETQDFSKLSFKQKRFGAVLQGGKLFPHMSALENVLFAGAARGIEKAVAVDEAKRLLKRLEVISSADKKAAVLSGGEAQRVALARALIGSPKFLFLDEPFSALDAGLREEARDLVKQIVAEASMPTLLITHDQQDVDALTQIQFQMKNGKLTN